MAIEDQDLWALMYESELKKECEEDIFPIKGPLAGSFVDTKSVYDAAKITLTQQQDFGKINKAEINAFLERYQKIFSENVKKQNWNMVIMNDFLEEFRKLQTLHRNKKPGTR